MAEGSGNQNFKSITGMIICIIIAALLWIIIKLTVEYTVTEPFAIRFTDIPADQIIQNENYRVEATMTTTGFKLMNYYLKAPKNREIQLSLKDINYKKINFETYSYSKRYLEESIAEFINATSNEVQVADELQYFVMSKLASKKVKIIPQTSFDFERQYNYYGEPIAIPDSATVFGTSKDIQDIQYIQTEVVSRKNVIQNIDTKAKLALKENIQCDVNEVEIVVNVEKYTEAEVEVPITIPDDTQLHLFPNKVKIRYIVAIKDYPIINDISFKVTIDPEGIFLNETLPVKLLLYPNNTQIISINPEEVEYIVVQ
ncbi:MAG: hypothetical protein II401_07440 [Bacteroidales bacterium]|nr:hypothetical protein [Bacteroidales bacterium]